MGEYLLVFVVIIILLAYSHTNRAEKDKILEKRKRKRQKKFNSKCDHQTPQYYNIMLGKIIANDNGKSTDADKDEDINIPNKLENNPGFNSQHDIGKQILNHAVEKADTKPTKKDKKSKEIV